MTGKWWLVTWGTYGSWLPGDARGFKTWRRRRHVPQPSSGEVYRPVRYTALHRQARDMCPQSVGLSFRERETVVTALSADLARIAVVPAALSVARQHVHLLAKFGELLIRPTVGRLKHAATQALKERGHDGLRVWAKGCHMESMPTADAFDDAVQYVTDHLAQGAAIFYWQMEYADDALPF